MQQADFEDAGEIFTELFAIQQALSAAKHKYLPDLELSSFLNDFLYFFDRQDEYNKRYLYTHFQQSNDLPD
ncbi:hypothetical protein A7P95_02355 [Eikenella longinqua]|uniref:Uncharacterized protein n=2 Tax=Neisseriaceae TaxID=481 RepID=A0A1A9S211_9NEIS|nr:hypothetical protein A7P95_02355 [Eikenella longinqua]